MEARKNNGQFSFNAEGEAVLREQTGDMTREPWLMLLARRGQRPTDSLCWGITNNGTTFARIGTQEGDILDGYLQQDPYKTRLLGNYAYFRFDDGAYFSNSWYPVLNDGQSLETVFGFGYLVFRTEYHGLQVETTNFIPDEYDALVQIIHLKNTSDEDQHVTMFNVAPVNLGDARDLQYAGFNSLMVGGALVDESLNATVWRFGNGREFDSDPVRTKAMFGKVFVHTTSLPNNQFATHYEEFVGHHTNTMADPAAVVHDWSLPSRDAEDSCSSLSSIRNSFWLPAHQEADIVVVGAADSTEDYYCDGKRAISALLADVLVPANAYAMLQRVKDAWKAEFDKLTVGVDEVDEILRPSYLWLQYQCAMVAVMNRMKSRFHSGYEYGYGFRDILQDILAILPTDPASFRQMLLFTAEQMFSDGFVYHNFFVSAPGHKDFVTSDDPLWLVYAVAEYIKTTGDFAVLDEVVPYCDAREDLPPSQGTLLEHLKVGLAKVWAQSDNGLPYMLMADWNDDLSGNFTSVSTMAAQQFYKALGDMAELLRAAGIEPELAADYAAKAETVKAQVEARCVDKEGYYIRAVASPNPEKVLRSLTFGHTGIDAEEFLEDLRQFGPPASLGSSDTDGLVFLEPLAWAGFSGIADKTRFDLCKQACEQALDDKFGIALCQGDRTLTEGKLPIDTQGWKRNAIGKKENGGEFRHPESWYIASLCVFGYGQAAHDMFFKTLPAVASEDDPFTYAAERFVYPEYVASVQSSEHGRAGHTWLTGTAPTRLNVLLDWIFGIRCGYDGLLIDPCVSPQWRSFRASREYRDTTFAITYSNPDGVEKGVRSITVDGEPVEGNLIPLRFAKGGVVDVAVVMG